ncbi:MAG: hypothetical protein L6R28_18510 [Planctomycetes bacterium]|nr:hypothetical protein [Planctomycetota bacterium]
MGTKELPEELLRTVAPNDLVEYLLARGWRQVKGIKKPIAVLRPRGRVQTDVQIPLNREFDDYYFRMSEAIAEVAAKESRAPVAVLNDLLVSSSDILRFRLDGPAYADGTIPLEDGLAFLNGSRKALLSAACEATEERPFFSKLTRGNSLEFLNSCRLGQTERGSFVAVLLCPLDVFNTRINNEEGLWGSDVQPDPFPRQVTKRLLNSTLHICRLGSTDQIERLVNPQRGDLQVSANLCEALLEMHNFNPRTNLEITTTWARSLSPGRKATESVEIPMRVFPVLEEVAAKLRPKQEPVQSIFIGKVAKLSAEANKEDRADGEIIFAFQGDDELIKAKVLLRAPDYDVACDAHKNGQYVTIKGIFVRGSRLHEIKEYSKFGIQSLF